jgi:PadR family transcriptional regulator, regulatory protein AphA
VSEARKLTTTAYVVLGLVAARQPITSYEMKRNVARSIGYFWPFPHSQLYAEPARLVGLGLLEEDVEESGRKRRRFRITEDGQLALSRWLAEPASEPTEIRDLGMLKLFFGSQARREDLVALATEQHLAHQRHHEEYEALRAAYGHAATLWELATLEVGTRYERMATEFWAEILDRAQRD